MKNSGKPFALILIITQSLWAAPLEVSIQWGKETSYHHCQSSVVRAVDTVLENERFQQMRSFFPEAEGLEIFLYPLKERSGYSGYYNKSLAPKKIVLDPMRAGTCQWQRKEQALSFARDFIHETHHLLVAQAGKDYSWEVNEGLSMLWESLITGAVNPRFFERNPGDPQVLRYRSSLKKVLSLYNHHSEIFFDCVYGQTEILSFQEMADALQTCDKVPRNP